MPFTPTCDESILAEKRSPMSASIPTKQKKESASGSPAVEDFVSLQKT
eukprot:CAMPEP_0184672442 /NCGR_PEP_ID=MMETSP0308-20130426/86101_1 /TAXON_ID=38269 /ORGANISM="Gloeochaete witrockiana, Strain SAG 46.84" /LENGTH=47 /DNA_ID= /DNA_START= /DNA_END= /DNA_ORIENTATION=